MPAKSPPPSTTQPQASLHIVTAADRPDLRAAGDRLAAAAWPAFLEGNAATIEYWDHLYGPVLSRFQFFAVNRHADGTERLVASANAIPFFCRTPNDETTLPEKGWDAILAHGVQGAALGQLPNALSALSIVVDGGERGKGVAEQMIMAMRDAARQEQFQAMVAPVRPTRKAQYPLETMESYLSWTTQDGAPFDPWIRKHWRLGARILGIAERSMEVQAPVSQWETWTGLRFPVSGTYHVAGALAPIKIDIEGNCGVYYEPNVWMRHF